MYFCESPFQGYTLAAGFGVTLVPGGKNVVETPFLRTKNVDLEIVMRKGKINWAMLDEYGNNLQGGFLEPITSITTIAPRYALDVEQLVKLRLTCLSGPCDVKGFISKGAD